MHLQILSIWFPPTMESALDKTREKKHAGEAAFNTTVGSTMVLLRFHTMSTLLAQPKWHKTASKTCKEMSPFPQTRLALVAPVDAAYYDLCCDHTKQIYDGEIYNYRYQFTEHEASERGVVLFGLCLGVTAVSFPERTIVWWFVKTSATPAVGT